MLDALLLGLFKLNWIRTVFAKLGNLFCRNPPSRRGQKHEGSLNQTLAYANELPDMQITRRLGGKLVDRHRPRPASIGRQ